MGAYEFSEECGADLVADHGRQWPGHCVQQLLLYTSTGASCSSPCLLSS